MRTVQIEWIDSQTTPGWKIKDVGDPSHIKTFGILVYEDKRNSC